ncbi:HmuY family protein [Ascidiimonas aurantiaca]|uniref:HmuY family protein n=1 Tax=Ascidiimonas aurantiaca TaxID=1685432 RepID=UPI0030EBF47D
MRSRFQLLCFLVFSTVFFVSCSDDDSNDGDSGEPIAVETFSNLHAPQQGGRGTPISGAFTKFSFATGDITQSETDWDIAFRGTRIAVNGGVETGTDDEPTRTGNAAIALVRSTFEGVTEAPEASLFLQDSANGFALTPLSDQGWYNYDGSQNLVTPLAGRVLVIRTHDGKYAKMEILSYYKDAPSQPDPSTDEERYYTFRYVYQADGSLSFVN